MRFARPPSGFHLVLVPAVDEFVRTTLGDHPELFRHWDALEERLRMAGHHMGEAVDGNSSTRYAAVYTTEDGPIIAVAWRVVGDTVTVVRASF